MNEIQYEQLVSMIEKLIEKKVRAILDHLGVESVSFGTISSLDRTIIDADGNITKVVRASVKLPDGNIISNLFNASSEILNIGDKVKIYGSKTNMSNRYIGIKYESEVGVV